MSQNRGKRKPIVDTLKQGHFFVIGKFFIQEGHKIGAKLAIQKTK
jgi:hypothetical protein